MGGQPGVRNNGGMDELPGQFCFWTGIIYHCTHVILGVDLFPQLYRTKKTDIFVSKERYQKSAYSDQQIEKCFEALALIKKNQLYKNPEITLAKAADLLNVVPNLLSETINRRTRQSFPDYINSLRIRDAKEWLKDPVYNNQKIATIAYDAGFSTISVFNAAFKKHTGVTPSGFRKKFAGTAA
jgi:YesN/AraC family two-component response regulator